MASDTKIKLVELSKKVDALIKSSNKWDTVSTGSSPQVLFTQQNDSKTGESAEPIRKMQTTTTGKCSVSHVTTTSEHVLKNTTRLSLPPASTSFELLFECFPIWLSSLELIWTSSITILGHNSFHKMIGFLTVYGYPTELVLRSYNRFSCNKFTFIRKEEIISSDPSKINLFSGSLEFVIQQFTRLRSVKQRVLGAVDRHYHQRFRHGRPTDISDANAPGVGWFRIRHETVGGSSTFIAVFGAFNCKNSLQPRTTPIRRSIQHVIDYGTRPHYVADPQKGPSDCLDIKKLLTTCQLDRNILIPTTFYKSQWGFRRLTLGELCSLFGFSVRLRVGGELPLSVFTSLVPIQLLHAILLPCMLNDECVNGKMPMVTLIQSKGDTLKQHPQTSSSQQSWLPTLGRWLPHLWYDKSVVTCQAVKRDDEYLSLIGTRELYYYILLARLLIWLFYELGCCVGSYDPMLDGVLPNMSFNSGIWA